MMSSKCEEIKSLTGLRGIAALYVALYHFKAGKFFGESLAPFFERGYIAVDLFFVLSGFVIALTYTSLFENGFNFSAFKNFMGRRIARIYPLYLIMTLIFVSFYLLFPDRVPSDVELSSTSIISSLFMIQAWGIALSILTPGWSISTEFAAYIVFPIFTLLMFKCKNYLGHYLFFISIFIIFIMSQFSLGSFYEIDNINNLNIWKGDTFYPLIRCLCEFAIGIWAYRLYAEDRKFKTILQGKWASTILGILLTCLLFITHTDALIVLLIPFFIISLTNEASTVSKFMSWRPIYLLGVISYSLYLCHLMTFWIKPELIEILTKNEIPSPYFLTFIFQMVISVILATAFYICIEKPGRTLLRKILK